MFQDNRRGTLFGMRTVGAGGSVQFDNAVGAYTDGFVGITRSLALRREPVATMDYPTTRYIENVGVRPDKEADYMTKENLLQNGKPFVQALSAFAVEYINANK
jgi:hypothetical protein